MLSVLTCNKLKFLLLNYITYTSITFAIGQTFAQKSNSIQYLQRVSGLDMFTNGIGNDIQRTYFMNDALFLSSFGLLCLTSAC